MPQAHVRRTWGPKRDSSRFRCFAGVPPRLASANPVLVMVGTPPDSSKGPYPMSLIAGDSRFSTVEAGPGVLMLVEKADE